MKRIMNFVVKNIQAPKDPWIISTRIKFSIADTSPSGKKCEAIVVTLNSTHKVRADQVCIFQLQKKISLKDFNVYAIEKVQKHLIQKFAFFHNWFRQRLHGAVEERMRRGQNKRKYAKLYFLHAQVGVTPKQAHPLLSMSFAYSARSAGTRACGRSGIATEHFASQSLVAFALFSLP